MLHYGSRKRPLRATANAKMGRGTGGEEEAHRAREDLERRRDGSDLARARRGALVPLLGLHLAGGRDVLQVEGVVVMLRLRKANE